jgi:hypothetical protein
MRGRDTINISVSEAENYVTEVGSLPTALRLMETGYLTGREPREILPEIKNLAAMIAADSSARNSIAVNIFYVSALTNETPGRVYSTLLYSVRESIMNLATAAETLVNACLLRQSMLRNRH